MEVVTLRMCRLFFICVGALLLVLSHSAVEASSDYVFDLNRPNSVSDLSAGLSGQWTLEVTVQGQTQKGEFVLREDGTLFLVWLNSGNVDKEPGIIRVGKWSWTNGNFSMHYEITSPDNVRRLFTARVSDDDTTRITGEYKSG